MLLKILFTLLVVLAAVLFLRHRRRNESATPAERAREFSLPTRVVGFLLIGLLLALLLWTYCLA